MPINTKANEVRLIRVYNASVKAVWDAWTETSQAAQWWGPRGFTITTHAKDLRVGGSWDYTMHGPDGTGYPNVTRYFEVEQQAKLVYDHGGSKDRPPMFRVTALFSESQGKTTLDMTMAFPTAEIANETRKFIKKANGDSTWDRLAEYLEKQATGQEKFVINRSFEVPLEKMFDAWTDPKRFSKWLPPTGFKMAFLKSDIKPGGKTFYCISNDEGMKMYGRTEYLEIVRPNRIVYTQQFCDEKEKTTRHPMSPLWPETMLTNVQLTEEAPEQTRVTITWQPFGPTTREEIEAFVNAKPGMTQGWTGSFDKLEEYLTHF